MIEFGDGGDTAVNRALADSFRHRLSIIREAKERIRIGAFGICANCGGPISERRLLTLPDTTLCVFCQRMHSRY